jgi:mannose-1-phosphate guanylyltransferase
MAGGAGVRFWPLSTPHHPKQLLTALAPRPLYVQASERARRLASWDRILVMSHTDFASLVRRQAPEVPAANVVLEPVRRNTAAAVLLAAHAFE